MEFRKNKIQNTNAFNVYGKLFFTEKEAEEYKMLMDVSKLLKLDLTTFKYVCENMVNNKKELVDILTQFEK